MVKLSLFSVRLSPLKVFSGEAWLSNAAGEERRRAGDFVLEPNLLDELWRWGYSCESSDTRSERRNRERRHKRAPLKGLSGIHTSSSGRRRPADHRDSLTHLLTKPILKRNVDWWSLICCESVTHPSVYVKTKTHSLWHFPWNKKRIGNFLIFFLFKKNIQWKYQNQQLNVSCDSSQSPLGEFILSRPHKQMRRVHLVHSFQLAEALPRGKRGKLNHCAPCNFSWADPSLNPPLQ